MPNGDTLQRFVFENADIRGEIAHLSASYETIMRQHNYPPVVRQLLGETLLAALLMTATIKFKGQLTVQFSGEGPVSLLVAKCDHHFRIRGLAQFDATALADDIDASFHSGRLVVTIQRDDKPQPYQSIIPLEGHSIAQGLEHYFSQSEQIPTRIWLSTDERSAAGMLIQLLPGKPNQEREDFWEYATKIGETITDSELLSLNNTTILHRLYHEEDLRLFDPQPVVFRCQCSHAGMREAIKLLGEAEANDMLLEKQVIQVTCEYCNRGYDFDRTAIEEIFSELH